MKILVLADLESKYLWDFYEKRKLEGIDLIISCGDLKASYLSFLATLSSVPVLYVPGNHDDKYDTDPPEGCICIDDDIFVYRGIRILGLGGSMCYNFGAHQYTEAAMRKRIRRLRLKLFYRKGFDILVTHAPAFGLNDGSDRAHVGFQIFHNLLQKYRPRYFVHGHMHMNYDRKLLQKREYPYNEYTTVVNAYEKYVLEYRESAES